MADTYRRCQKSIRGRIPTYGLPHRAPLLLLLSHVIKSAFIRTLLLNIYRKTLLLRGHEGETEALEEDNGGYL